jgi:predicted LPLAT superfamily acyltransferase
VKLLFYRLLIVLRRWFGAWLPRALAWCIATGYFLTSPGRVRTGRELYAAAFPERSRWQHFLLVWSQFQHFATVFIERLLVNEKADFAVTGDGLEPVLEAVRAGRGAVLIMSHLGSWEIAARLLRRYEVEMLLIMGAKQKEQIEALQKQDLTACGCRILAVPEGEESPLVLIEAARMLKRGGLVSLPGDRMWTREHRCEAAKFLGHPVTFPLAPHVLALTAGAPLIPFFAFRVRAGEYRVEAATPWMLEAAGRDERQRVLTESVQEYARCLEEALRRFPEQWYHFEPLLPTPCAPPDATMEPPADHAAPDR